MSPITSQLPCLYHSRLRSIQVSIPILMSMSTYYVVRLGSVQGLYKLVFQCRVTGLHAALISLT
jgi:hypothetical protein